MRIITVRECQELWEIIEEIVSDEEFCMIYIDSAIIEEDKLVKQKSKENYVYKFEQDGYKMVLDIGDDTNNGWYFLWNILKPNEEYLYSISTPYLLDYLHGKCECTDIYIKKYGSETKIDEG